MWSGLSIAALARTVAQSAAVDGGTTDGVAQFKADTAQQEYASGEDTFQATPEKPCRVARRWRKFCIHDALSALERLLYSASLAKIYVRLYLRAPPIQSAAPPCTGRHTPDTWERLNTLIPSSPLKGHDHDQHHQETTRRRQHRCR